jgi:hypothetical protein
MKYLVFALMALPLAAHATSGGVDKNGCHHSKGNGFHCHPERVGHPANAQTYKISTKVVKKAKPPKK